MANVHQETLAARLEQAIEAQAGVNVVVEENGDTLVLSGRVDTAEARQAAEDIARALVPGRQIDNDLEVEQVVPQEVANFNAGIAPAALTPESVADLETLDAAIEPDFADQAEATYGTSGLATAGVDTLEEADTVFSPPTDPVITTDNQGEVKVLGGFSPSSMSSIDVEPSASDGQLGDEAIADAVRRELREDAATTDLRVHVVVIDGVVHLRGQVAGVEDTDNAADVASRVPGVQDVVDELRVTQL